MTDTATGSTLQRVVDILAEQTLLDPADIHAGSTLDQLAVDSLGLVEIVFSIEEAFDIQVPFNANEPAQSDFDISTVATMAAAVEKLVSEKP